MTFRSFVLICLGWCSFLMFNLYGVHRRIYLLLIYELCLMYFITFGKLLAIFFSNILFSILSIFSPSVTPIIYVILFTIVSKISDNLFYFYFFLSFSLDNFHWLVFKFTDFFFLISVSNVLINPSNESFIFWYCYFLFYLYIWLFITIIFMMLMKLSLCLLMLSIFSTFIMIFLKSLPDNSNLYFISGSASIYDRSCFLSFLYAS